MIRLVMFLALLSLTPSLLVVSAAQYRRDPLTAAEADELRDAAQEPEARLILYVKFARARLTTLDQARTDPKVTDRGQEIHDRLQDFLDVYDEMSDNIDTFVGRRADLRKPLKFVIEADTEFQSKLRALKDSADLAKEAPKYEFLLSTAFDTVDHGVEDHRQLLAEQEEAAKHKPKRP
jgi:hypothetical protein